MKFLIVFVAIVALACADDEWKPKTALEIKNIRTECLKEHPVSAENLEKMKTVQFPDVEEVRQYLLCSAVKLDIFCTVEGYHADRVAKQFKMDLDEAEVLTIVNGCIDKNEQGSTADVWAFRGHQCLMKSKLGERLIAFLKKKREEAAKSA